MKRRYPSPFKKVPGRPFHGSRLSRQPMATVLILAASLWLWPAGAFAWMPELQPDVGRASGTRTESPHLLGMDMVLVIDSTAGMEKWFQPTAEVLATFAWYAREQAGSTERSPLFRMGLLLYRDRKNTPDCDLEYLFRWEMELTSDVTAVSRALAGVREASCGSEEPAEAVYDALSRAVQDPPWADGSFKIVLLIGDAPPHPPSNKGKNPLGLDTEAITKMAEERNIRFLTLKIGLSDLEEFEALARPVRASALGRFHAVERDDLTAYKRTLLVTLQEEWGHLMAGNAAVAGGLTDQHKAADN